IDHQDLVDDARVEEAVDHGTDRVAFRIGHQHDRDALATPHKVRPPLSSSILPTERWAKAPGASPRWYGWRRWKAATLRRQDVIFRRKGGNGGQAVREREAPARGRAALISSVAEGLPPLEELLEEIEDVKGGDPDRRLEADRRLVRLRHLAGIQLLDR